MSEDLSVDGVPPYYDLKMQSVQTTHLNLASLQKRSQLRTYGVGFSNLYASKDLNQQVSFDDTRPKIE